MMGKGDISPWLPEPDLGIHQCVTKIGEESAELSKICFRILGQGIAGSDPRTGQPNVEALIDELSDVNATQEFAQRVIGITARADRILRKLDGYERWFKMIGVDMGNGEEAMQAEPAPVPSNFDTGQVVYTQAMYKEYEAALLACIIAGYPGAKPSELIVQLSERIAELELREASFSG